MLLLIRRCSFKHEVCSRTHTARMDLLTGGEEAPGESVQGMGGRIGRVEGEIGPRSSEFDATDSKTNDANADDSSTQRRHREPPPPPPGVDIGELRGLHLGGDEDVGPALTGCSRHSRPPPPPPVKDDAGDVTDQTYAVVDGLTVEAVDAYFREADTNGTGRIVGGEAMVFFLRTGIPVEVRNTIRRVVVTDFECETRDPRPVERETLACSGMILVAAWLTRSLARSLADDDDVRCGRCCRGYGSGCGLRTWWGVIGSRG